MLGYSMRGGRMLTTDNYECTWDLYKSLPSLNHPGKSVFDETVEFNERHVSNSMARLSPTAAAMLAQHASMASGCIPAVVPAVCCLDPQGARSPRLLTVPHASRYFLPGS
jgi:hypothetical protein